MFFTELASRGVGTYNGMMRFFSNHKVELGLLLVLIITYFLLRLPNLTSQPIFADEAIYIRWAQVMRAEPTLRFISVTDGKTPLFMWILIPFFKIFSDPLFAGRFLSVLSGLATLFGVMALGWKVFGKKVAFWAGLIYTITPYSVFFDRMALVDSMLSAFTIWVIYFALWLVEKLRLDLAMILGYLMGGAILTKTTGLLNLLILPFSIIAFNKKRMGKNSLLKLFLFWGVAIAVALVMYNILRLGPEFQKLSARNTDYVFSPFELKGRLLDPFIPHFHDISDWFPKLFSWPILILGIFGIAKASVEKNKLRYVLLLWTAVPLLLSMAFLKTFTARYLLTSVAPFLIFAGFGLTELLSKVSLKNNIKILISLLAILPISLKFDYQLLTNPPPNDLPKEERIGYFEDWTAGFGFSQIANYLLDQKKNGPVVLGTEGYFGTLPDGLQIYLDKANISIVGSHATISAQLREAAKNNLTFFVGNKENLKKVYKNLRLILEFPKAKSKDTGLQDATVLYQVLPENP